VDVISVGREASLFSNTFLSLSFEMCSFSVVTVALPDVDCVGQCDRVAQCEVRK